MTAVDVEVLVVGAGPAGVAAGIEATRLGLSTLVLDKARFPRDKTCGDGLTAGALRLLDGLGLDVRRLPSYVTVHETVIVGPDGHEVVLPLPDDGEYAGVVPRRELDAALVLLARRRGVDVRDGTGLTALAPATDTLVATLDDGTGVRASWVVAADGHYSATRRLVQPVTADLSDPSAPDLGTWHAFRQYFRGVDDPRLWVLFERDLLPGYAWVFPLGDGRANVGFGVLRDDVTGGKQLAALWRDVVARTSVRRILGERAEPDGPHRSWPIPATWSEAALSGPARTLFVGDAAGVVDPMTGEGIAQALETGMLAGACGRVRRPPEQCRRAVPRRGPRRARRRPALRGRAATHPALTDRRARGDRRRGPHRLDPPQLRALDVRGLPARGRHDAAALAARHVHAVGRVLALSHGAG